MKAFQEFLKDNPNGVMTAISDNKPYSRVFQFLWAEGNKAFFCTANNKDVYKAITSGHEVSFCAWNPETFEVFTLNGKAIFIDDQTRKQRVLDENPMIADIYKTADNPVFEIFYVEVETIHNFDFEKGSRTERLA